MNKAIKQKSFEELYEELCKLPETVVGQILNGELVAMPRPASKHAHVHISLGGKLGDPFNVGRSGPGGWLILNEPEVRLKDHVFVPDLVGWKKERLPKNLDVAYFDLAPDWACEILSPNSIRYDRIVKMNLYAQFKIPYYWIIDPTAKILEVFTLESGKWALESFAESDKVSASPFKAIEFDLGDLWLD